MTPDDPADATPRLRIARPVRALAPARDLYVRGLDWAVLGAFEDHAGFDGVMLGPPGGAYHLEFTVCRTHPVTPSPTPEDLLVLYLPDRGDWQRRCEALRAAGFREVASFNPYWQRDGRSFEDADGYRIVIQCAAWPAPPGD